MLEGVARLCKGSLAACFDKGSLSSWWLLRDQPTILLRQATLESL